MNDDEIYEYLGQTFEWNRSKARRNLLDHKNVSFESAASVFMDPNSIQFPDDKEFDDELRDVLIGFSESGMMLRVSFTYRPPNLRIFSARVADKYDETRYENGY